MADSEAKKRWVKLNTTRIVMNLNHRTDADIISKLKEQESIQGYIKQLIRNDMKKAIPIPEPAKAENNFNATLELFKAINKTAHD